jgi:hypothetical protein
MWTLREDAREATIDLHAVPGIGAEIVLTVASCGALDSTARTSRRSCAARLRTRARLALDGQWQPGGGPTMQVQ